MYSRDIRLLSDRKITRHWATLTPRCAFLYNFSFLDQLKKLATLWHFIRTSLAHLKRHDLIIPQEQHLCFYLTELICIKKCLSAVFRDRYFILASPVCLKLFLFCLQKYLLSTKISSKTLTNFKALLLVIYLNFHRI